MLRMPTDHPVDRRAFLATGLTSGALAGAGWLSLPAVAAMGSADGSQPAASSAPGSAPVAAASRRRALRVAHLTDIHVQPERGAAEGMAAALRDVAALDEPVDLVLTGGDHIMDCFAADEARTRTQWELYSQVLRDNCRIPVRACIGNHDIWGWSKAESRTRGDEPRWGKTWAREVLGLEADHGAFVQGGWKFILLDSVRAFGDGYTGHLQPAQREWLEAELAATPSTQPVCVLSHIPLLTVTVIAGDAKRAKDLSITVPGDLMHSDAATVCGILARHPNVKLCLSGHIHQIDRIEWRGITFICDGAVSGAWWKGPNGSTPEGYGVLDLYDDGTLDWRYRTYGWKAQA